MSHVFISYSRKDSEYAHKLASELRQQDFHVWIDDRIESSDDWWKKIHQAIVDCAAFIVIMTPESAASKWVQREVTLADSLNRVAFPILLDGDADISKSPAWSIYIRTQFTIVKHGEFPKPSFYETLRSVVSTNTQKIRFDGYYECITYNYQGLNTFHYTYAIVFTPDGRLTEFSLQVINPIDIETDREHVLDGEYPDGGIYQIIGDIITITLTEPYIQYRKDMKYHGYIEGENLKLEIDDAQIRNQFRSSYDQNYEVPWHLKERRLYRFKPFPENNRPLAVE